MAHEVGFSVGTVARRLGIAPSTLRTWNRRYGIGAQELSPGKHRRYTAEDISRLEHMQKLILRGAAPADAARAALAGGLGAGGNAPAPDAPPAPPRPGPGHGAGGQRLALPRASGAARGLARAALALDDTLMAEIIETALARDGVIATWQNLLVPVLSGLGARYAHAGECIEAEHLLSSVILAALAGVRPGPVPPGHRAVLLAAAPGEMHTLPLYALAAALGERGVAARLLGADLPYRSLAAAVARSGPAAVFLWSQTPASGDARALPVLRPRRPGARLLLGGPGWPQGALPADARLAGSLPEAVAEVLAALGRS
jgi:MerR family transcriptional regulator, light-induced transcriptional regulator